MKNVVFKIDLKNDQIFKKNKNRANFIWIELE